MSTASWDAIVIGSGIGGLAAAAAYARAGKRVLVLEQQGGIGGAATVYRHGPLTIEASLHEIDGAEWASKAGAVAQLGLADRLDPLRTDLFYEARSSLFAQPVRVPHGLDAAEAVLAAAFPNARAGLRRWFADLRRVQQTMNALEELSDGPAAVAATLSASRDLWAALSDMRGSLHDELEHHFSSDEAVKLALAPHLSYFDDDPRCMSMLLFAMVTARYLEHGSYYLRGGSKSLTLALLAVIQDSGGEALTHRMAIAILVDPHGRVAGVRHRGEAGDIEETLSATVFGNAAPALLATMLPKNSQESFSQRYAAFEPSISLFVVALGLDRPAAEFGVSAYSTFLYPDWMDRLDAYPRSAALLAGGPGHDMPLYAMADYGRLKPRLGQPDGPALLTLTGADRLANWATLDRSAYTDRRERWMDALIIDIDRRYPGIGSAITQREMATARTMHDRLGAPHGEVYGFRPTPERVFDRLPGPKTTVEGLWLASARTVSGGYAGSMQGGMMAAKAALNFGS